AVRARRPRTATRSPARGSTRSRWGPVSRSPCSCWSAERRRSCCGGVGTWRAETARGAGARAGRLGHLLVHEVGRGSRGISSSSHAVLRAAGSAPLLRRVASGGAVVRLAGAAAHDELDGGQAHGL